ncbi:MAG TPA: sigma 54-interacting transcriptional regulator [Myxococcales bacterium]|nr:sigma 54-interacting transcriptional regulator [Myxococcales bacterium]
MSNGNKAPTLTLVREAQLECVEVPRARVRLRRPGQEDVEAPLGLSPVVLGSGAECELRVDDPYVSRRHCQLSLHTAGVVVRDLGSRNGTWINEVRIVEGLLPPGGVVSLGQMSVTVAGEGAPQRLELSSTPAFGEAIGTSPVMRALFARLQRAALTEEPILLLGESGTGKELLARAIHDASSRREGPFAVFDCGAVAPTLIESELFGYEKGAFSGAAGARKGILESAKGGTVFFDELGELPLELQPKLLRALESREVRPVGSNALRPLDIRVVAATHRDLRARMAEGAFREDLYYRLAVVEARVPALRERLEDLPLLVERILSQRTPPGALEDLPPATLQMLSSHSWPGNVRELRNTLARLALFPTLGREAIQAAGPSGSGASPEPSMALPFHQARQMVISEFERRYVTERLEVAGGNVSAAARAMGVSRQFLHRLIAEHGLKAQDQ